MPAITKKIISENIWKTTSSKIDYENPFMRITKNEVVRPNGHSYPFYVLERETCSIIIPLIDSLTTYLVGQYRYAIKQYSWEFPCGSVKKKKPLVTAKQELNEETGITAQKWTEIGEYAIAPGHNSQRCAVFIAQNLTLGKSHPEAGEILQMKKIKLSKVGDMIAQGEIIDGLTICAFHYLEVYLHVK